MDELPLEEEDRLVQEAEQAVGVFGIPLRLRPQPEAAQAVGQHVAVGVAGKPARRLVNPGLPVRVVARELDADAEPGGHPGRSAERHGPLEPRPARVGVEPIPQPGVVVVDDGLVPGEAGSPVPLVPGLGPVNRGRSKRAKA